LNQISDTEAKNFQLEGTYSKTERINDEKVVFEVCDLAGREEYVAMRDQGLRSAEGMVLCYDITDKSTFDSLLTYQNEFYRAKELQTSTVHAAPIVISGCKSDLTDQRKAQTHPFFWPCRNYWLLTELY